MMFLLVFLHPAWQSPVCWQGVIWVKLKMLVAALFALLQNLN
jgi:hypothetical protein